MAPRARKTISRQTRPTIELCANKTKTKTKTIQWYESVKNEDSTYYLSKNRHMLDMRSVNLAPQGITLIEHPVDKTTKHYTVKKEDHDMHAHAVHRLVVTGNW